MKKAFITGITGQDGSYLAEFLLSKGYEVHGLIRRASTFNTSRIDHLYVDPHEPDAKLFLYYGDLSDSDQVSNIISKIKPDEVYHLGAQTHVRVSFDSPEYTSNVTALGTIRILEAIRRSGEKIKFYQASSSEMFGNSHSPQDETTPFSPRSPYAISKLFSYWTAINYREAYGIPTFNGILFNHESPRRGEIFVTRKISRAIANIFASKQRILYLGNTSAERDWGYAPEYVEAMWKMLQQKKPDDFVLGTGESHTVKDFLELAFTYVDLDYEKYVEIDRRYYRPTDVDKLVANSNKAKNILGWNPRIKLGDLVKIMVDADIRKVGLVPHGEGDKIIKKLYKWKKVD